MQSGIYIENLRNGAVYEQNADAIFETGSAIKSPLAALAVNKALTAGQEIDRYTITVSREHRSNGSGNLKIIDSDMEEHLVEDNRNDNGSCTLTLRALLYLNVVDSDCTATNAVIDYIGGKDAANAAFETELGIEGLRLVTDKLHFPGVDHTQQPYQVGAANPRAFGRYYTIMARRQKLFEHIPENTFKWFAHLHGVVDNTWIFDEAYYPAVEGLLWYHKTGSVIDRSGNTFYANAADAGNLLTTARAAYSIAAFALQTECPRTDGHQLEMFEKTFARRCKTAFRKANIDLRALAQAASEVA